MADSDKIKQDTEAAAKSAGDLKDNFADVVDLTDQLSGAMMGFLQALGSSNIGLNQAKKSARSLLRNQQTLEEVQLGLSKMSSQELKTLKAASLREKKRLKDAVDFIQTNVKGKRELTAQEAELIAASEQNFAIEQASIDAIQAKIDQRIEEEKRLGLTGVALDNLGRIGIRALGGIGVNLGALQGDFDAVTDEVEELAGKDGVSRFKIFGTAIAATGPIFKKVITDPAVLSLGVFSKLTDAFVKVEAASVNFQRLTGQTSIAAGSLNTRIATTAQYLETAAALTEELGFNANNAFSPDTLAAAAEIQNQLGLSADEAGRLAVLTNVTGRNFDDIKESIVDSVSSFNRVNKTAISQGVVLKDVANASEDILASFNGQTEALTESATAARRLGVDIDDLNSIAGSLLDFESSIQNELEAQLLTGRELNLNKARELALNNDLAGVGEELFKNSSSLVEFSNMNRIAQEAQAKALGLSRQELAKIALQKSIELGLTNKNLEAAANITAQDLERVALQDQLNLSIQKITQSLAGPAAFLASMVESTFTLNAIMATFAGVTLMRAAVGLSALVTSFKKLAIFSSLTKIGLTGPKGLATLAAAALAVPFIINKASKVDDGIISPDGGLVVSGPKGSYQLNSGDTVVAGTNLGGTPAWAERLIAAVEKGGDVYIDGNKAGTAMALGTYKL